MARLDQRNATKYWCDRQVPGLSLMRADFTSHDYGRAHFMRRDAPATAACSERLLSVAREHGVGLYQAHGGTLHAWARCKMHGGDDPVAQLRTYFQRWKATSYVMLDMGAGALADVEIPAGNLDQAAAAIAEAQAVGLGWWDAEVLRFRGTLTLAGLLTDGRDAEYWYQKASWHSARRQSRSNCAQRQRWRGCGRSKGAAATRATCWRRSTIGSPRGSTRLI
jgi:hypothetical protein